jgi:hypothetical protein
VVKLPVVEQLVFARKPGSIHVHAMFNTTPKLAHPDLQAIYSRVGFESLVAVTVRSKVFWAATPHGSKDVRDFGGIYRLHLQDKTACQVRNQQKQATS